MSSSIERQATPDLNGHSLDAMGARVAVLIADDNEAVLHATSDLVAEFPGVGVIARADNVDETVRQAAAHQPDLALVDAWLRGGGVDGAVRRIIEVSPRTLVVALASNEEPELQRRIRNDGALGCYQKETLAADLPAILAAIRSRLEGS